MPSRSNRARPPARLPSIAVFVVRNWVVGALLGAAFAALLILTNAGGLHDLLRQSSDAAVAAPLLIFGFATLVAALYCGAAIMLVSIDDA